MSELGCYVGSVGAALWLSVCLGCGSLWSLPRRPPDFAASAIREPFTADQSFRFEVGEVLAGEPVRHVFEYRNATAQALRLAGDGEIQTTCGCTRVKLADDHLAPGGSTSLAFEISTDGRVGDIAESATVTWQDAAGQLKRCQFTVTAHVRSAFAFDPPELTFSKRDLREGTAKRVRCQSQLPLDWTGVTVQPEAAFVVVEDMERDEQRGEISFAVRCLPEQQAETRRAAIRVIGCTPAGGGGRARPWQATLPVFADDLADLRISPQSPTLVPAGDDQTWQGYLVLTGDLVEAGVALREIAAPRCQVHFESAPLGASARRVDLTVTGPLAALDRQQRQLLLTFDNGRQQRTAFRLTDDRLTR